MTTVNSAYSNVVAVVTLSVDVPVPEPIPEPAPLPTVSTAVRVLWAEMEAPPVTPRLSRISIARRDLWSVMRKKKGHR